MANDEKQETVLHASSLVPEADALQPIATHRDMTAADDRDPAQWRRIPEMPEFKSLLKAKRRFILPATLFFVIYYFALPVLVGYAPAMMSRKVFGVVNIAYLFALSQFFMAWAIAALYLRAASRFDKMEQHIVEKAREK